MSVVVLIPARYASTRLPGKALLDRTGKPLIQHVVEAVQPTRGIDRVVVATDDQRIASVVQAFGGGCVMTRPDHLSGTDRLAEAAGKLGLDEQDIVINVQGDEPEMPPDRLERLVELLETSDTPMATLCTPLPPEDAHNPSRVKVVVSRNGRALYFSRAAIPFDRDGLGTTAYRLHFGIYAYRCGFLRQYASLPPTPAEESEKLEQLRVLEHGYSIAIAEVESAAPGIDTPEDYEAFVRRMEGRT